MTSQSENQSGPAVNGATSHENIRPSRLPSATYQENFSDVKPPLSETAALVEASRCYFCFDAPCIEACPTGIDIPQFIRKISTGNLKGAATEILKENIFGGSCARVCPTEVLCEEACVRLTQEAKPVAIGRLQRHATDFLMDDSGNHPHPFARAASSGRRVAVIGAGPAGLSCAHGLSRKGHDVMIFEARDKAGGLNEYGIAAYKVPDDFAQRELDFITALGGIEIKTGTALGRDLSLADLRRDYDAVFVAIGLTAAQGLNIAGADLDGVIPAIDYIAALRQAADLSALPVADKVVVIGGGNTAIDIAVQSKRLGADHVTLAYRRGPKEMGATHHEQDFAQTNGVTIQHWVMPRRIVGDGGKVTAIELERSQIGDDGRLAGTGDIERLAADTVFLAIGQRLVSEMLDVGGTALNLDGHKIAVDEHYQTNIEGIFAGGDCISTGEDLTVQSVEDGKRAAASIDTYLS